MILQSTVKSNFRTRLTESSLAFNQLPGQREHRIRYRQATICAALKYLD